MSRRVAVLGMGLIGGSVAMALRSSAGEVEVVAYDPDPTTVKLALESGAVDRVAGGAGEAVAGASLVILATPVDVIGDVIGSIAGATEPDAVVTDVGSSKTGAVEAGERFFGGRFVGGHPMAGSERHGFAAADAALFDDAWWILTPTEETDPGAFRVVRDVVKGFGARPVAVAPSVHDDLLARLSHVPQIAASALVASARGDDRQDELLSLAAGGFRDVTRIAASDPDLWVAILQTNRAAVLEALDGLSGRLVDVSEMIRSARWDELRTFLDSARSARLELFVRPDLGGAPVTLALPVQDRPGLLAEVTTAAGEIGANIEDLRIIHSTEGGQGRLELVIAGEDRAAALAERLRALGYRVEQLPPGVESYG